MKGGTAATGDGPSPWTDKPRVLEIDIADRPPRETEQGQRRFEAAPPLDGIRLEIIFPLRRAGLDLAHDLADCRIVSSLAVLPLLGGLLGILLLLLASVSILHEFLVLVHPQEVFR